MTTMMMVMMMGSDDGEMVGIEVGTNEHVPQAKNGYTPRLSARQQSILRCLIQGDSNKTIARKMAIAEATVTVSYTHLTLPTILRV